MKLTIATVCLLAIALAGCSSQGTFAKSSETKTPAAKKYRPYGDETVKIDMSQIKNEDLKKIYQYIDDHFDEHVERLQKWIRQPSISNSGEGIQETAEMVKGFFDELGCQQTRVYGHRHYGMGTPRKPRRLRQVRRGRQGNFGHLLAIRHNASYAARQLEGSSIRCGHYRRWQFQEGAHCSRREQF